MEKLKYCIVQVFVTSADNGGILTKSMLIKSKSMLFNQNVLEFAADEKSAHKLARMIFIKIDTVYKVRVLKESGEIDIEFV